ncbi:MAG: pyruvoyl-dependent arginine decarboxylase [Candidatus Aminicenantia bacterium]
MGTVFIPKRIFLTKGVGRHKEKLASFEEALRTAGIAPFNLVKTSSIFPPGCDLISKEEGLKLLKPGQIVFCVMSENSTDEPHRLISASIGLAIPRDKDTYGYLSEHHSFGEKEEDVGDYAEDLAASMLATTLGLAFDSEQSWDERRGLFKISGKIVTTKNITQTAVGKKGYWTTVIAAAIFII